MKPGAAGLVAGLLALSIAPRPAGAADRACDARASGSALIVMDMQPLYLEYRGVQDQPDNAMKVEALLAEQTEVIRAAMRARIPVIVVEYEDPDTIESFSEAPSGSHYDDERVVVRDEAPARKR